MSKIHLLLAALLGFMFLGQINSSPSDENTPLVFLNDTNGNSIDSFAMDEFGNIEFNLKNRSLKIVAGDNQDGSAPNQFSHPFQLITKTNDFILVADAQNNRIQKWKLN